MCFLLPVWLMTQVFKVKKNSYVSSENTFSFQVSVSFFSQSRMSNFIPRLLFSSSALKRLAKILPKMLLSLLKTRTISLFSCSLKHLFKNTFLLSILWQCWISAFLQRTLKHVFLSSLLLLLLAPARTGWLVTNLMSLSQWLLCNTVSQEFGLIGRHCPRLMAGNLGISLFCKCRHKLLLLSGAVAILAELRSLYGMFMKLLTVKLTFILVMKLIQGFNVVFLIHSVSLCHCVLSCSGCFYTRGNCQR